MTLLDIFVVMFFVWRSVYYQTGGYQAGGYQISGYQIDDEAQLGLRANESSPSE